MKKNTIAYVLLISSILVAVIALVVQSKLTIFSFLLIFYLLPLLLFSMGVGFLSVRVISNVVKTLIGGVVFTAMYTLSYYLQVIDFQQLIAATNMEGVSIENVSMDFSSILNTFLMVVVMIWLSRVIMDRFSQPTRC